MQKLTAKKSWMLVGIGMAGLIVAVDFTIVNTVLPTIQNDLNASMNLLQWVMTGFGITFSSLLITSGRLGDLLGHRLVLLIGIIGFALASLAAGLSHNIEELIIARVFQGIFGSTVFPCGIAVISAGFNTNEQGRVLGLYGSILGIGLAIGPVLGGFITTIANWRWIFLINLPIIFISLVLCLLFAPESKRSKTSIDWIGMILMTTFLALVVFAITQSQVYGWGSYLIIISFLLAFTLFVLFVLIEKNQKNPILPFKLLNNRSFLASALVFSNCVGLSWSIVFFIPLYLQTTLGLSELNTGLIMVPMTLMTVIAPMIAGYLFDHEGPYLTTVIAFVSMIIGLLLCVFFSASLHLFLIIFSFFMIGLAWGIGNGIAMPLALSNPQNRAHEGVISGVTITILNVYGVLILSIATALFHHVDNQGMGLIANNAQNFLLAFRVVMGFLLGSAILALLIIMPIVKDPSFKKK